MQTDKNWFHIHNLHPRQTFISKKTLFLGWNLTIKMPPLKNQVGELSPSKSKFDVYYSQQNAEPIDDPDKNFPGYQGFQN